MNIANILAILSILGRVIDGLSKIVQEVHAPSVPAKATDSPRAKLGLISADLRSCADQVDALHGPKL